MQYLFLFNFFPFLLSCLDVSVPTAGKVLGMQMILVSMLCLCCVGWMEASRGNDHHTTQSSNWQLVVYDQ